MLILLLIFIVIPLAEIAVFIHVGGLIGLWATIGLVVITAIIGTSLLRWQGYSVLARTQNSLNSGELPVDSVIDGVFLLVAGALLLTPGLITDTFGFLLFVPQFRRLLARTIFNRMIAKGKVRMDMYSDGQSTSYSGSSSFEADPFSDARYDRKTDPDIIDAEFTDVDEKKSPQKDEDDKPAQPNPSSPWRHKP